MISQSIYLSICLSLSIYAWIYKLDVEPFEHPFKLNARQRLIRSANGCVLIKYIFPSESSNSVQQHLSYTFSHLCVSNIWMDGIYLRANECVRVFVCVHVDVVLTLMRSNSVRAVYNFVCIPSMNSENGSTPNVWCFSIHVVVLLELFQVEPQVCYALQRKHMRQIFLLLAKSLASGLKMLKLTTFDWKTISSFFFTFAS